MGNPRCEDCPGFRVGTYIETKDGLMYFMCDVHGIYTTGAGPTKFSLDNEYERSIEYSV